MDSIEFQVIESPHWYEKEISIRINGVDLIDLVREIERPFADAEGSPSIAGAYSGLPAAAKLPPSRHFWEGSGGKQPNDKVELLVCGGCGEIGCWPLMTRIEIRDGQVIWSDFEQPHRAGWKGGTAWDYRGFGPFVFDLKGYEAALRIAAEQLSRT